MDVPRRTPLDTARLFKTTVLFGLAGGSILLAAKAPDHALRLSGSAVYFAPAIFLILASGGFVGRFFGVHNLFRDDAQIFGPKTRTPGAGQPPAPPAATTSARTLAAAKPWGRLGVISRTLASPAFWSGATFAALAHYAFFIAYAATPSECREKWPPICDELLFLPSGLPPAQALLYATPYQAILIPLTLAFIGVSLFELRRPLATLRRRDPWLVTGEVLRVLLGLLLGTLFGWAVYLWAAGASAVDSYSLDGSAANAGAVHAWAVNVHVQLKAASDWLRALTAYPPWDDLPFAGKVGIFLVVVGALTFFLRRIRDWREEETPRPGGPSGIFIGVGGILSGAVILVGLYSLANAAPTGHMPKELWWVVWGYAVPAVVTFVLRPSLPCVSMAILGALLISTILLVNPLAHAIFDALPDEHKGGWIVGLVVFTLAYLLITNGQPFRYKVPGFDYAGTANPQVPGDVFRNRNSPGDTPQQPPTLDPTKALAYWKDKKLVVLCLSGGAYRATFWSSIVIDHLAKTHPTFKKSVHLITGASGGMVAGAYFAAMQAKAIAGDVTTRIEEETRTALKDEGRALPICRDSLSSVAQWLVQWDLRDLLLPGGSRIDRGVVLERTWRTLDETTFSDLKREGSPSLIVSPMLVETGAPALFSNLDLIFVRNRSGEEPDKTSLEVFRTFPNAFMKCRLSTAVRLNATFPYISPAVALPLQPERRAIDAGYYDGFGVDIATDYLGSDAVLKKITETCEGVLIIEIRAFPSDQPTPPIGRLSRALQFLTTPFEGLSIARRSSQAFRNGQELDSLQLRYTEAKGPKFLTVCTLEANADVSMSWYTRDDEMQAMRGLLTSPNTDELAFSVNAFGNDDAAYMEALQRRKLKARIVQNVRHRTRISNELDRIGDFFGTVDSGQTDAQPQDTRSQ